jgi:hypothetical protein
MVCVFWAFFMQYTSSASRCTDAFFQDIVGWKDIIGSSDSVFSFLLILACGIFSSLGPKSVYKDMLNNMVSLIGHVVMNYQNQTRTNGIWGHVRYNDTMGEPWSRIHPVQLKINYARVIWMWIAENVEESV